MENQTYSDYDILNDAVRTLGGLKITVDQVNDIGKDLARVVGNLRVLMDAVMEKTSKNESKAPESPAEAQSEAQTEAPAESPAEAQTGPHDEKGIIEFPEARSGAAVGAENGGFRKDGPVPGVQEGWDDTVPGGWDGWGDVKAKSETAAGWIE
jgi:hypothetical protein